MCTALHPVPTPHAESQPGSPAKVSSRERRAGWGTSPVPASGPAPALANGPASTPENGVRSTRRSSACGPARAGRESPAPRSPPRPRPGSDGAAGPEALEAPHGPPHRLRSERSTARLRVAHSALCRAPGRAPLRESRFPGSVETPAKRLHPVVVPLQSGAVRSTRQSPTCSAPQPIAAAASEPAATSSSHPPSACGPRSTA
jgi:hypothetical protein